MNDFQKKCVAAINRSLGDFGVRPTVEVRAGEEGAYLRADFRLVQDAYEVFLYAEEVAVQVQGRRQLFHLRDFGHVDRALARALGEFLRLCAAGMAADAAAEEIRTDHRLTRRALEGVR